MMTRVALVSSILAALAAVIGAVVIGHQLFEDTVVPDPYEAGLKYDQHHGSRSASSGPENCNLTTGPCRVLLESGLQVTLEIEPRPIRAMQDLMFSAHLEKKGLPVENATVGISLTMPGMVMGDNRLSLRPSAPGFYRGSGVIPLCPSGATVWEAAISIDSAVGHDSAAFLFSHQ